MLFDVIVVGGGHAGCEAAAAAARVGARTALVTPNRNTIGEMSCNPSFGGIGKGHLMREVDALDGLCGRVSDFAGIHFKVLNRSRGPAVWGLRAQIDRDLYKRSMQAEIESLYPKLTVIEKSVEDLMLGSGRENIPKVTGCAFGDGTTAEAASVVICTGTFLSAEIFVGRERHGAGRIGEPSTSGLSRTLSSAKFRLARLKTGTPPRLDGNTVDFTSLERIRPDSKPLPFSFLHSMVRVEPSRQLSCFLTHFDPTLVRPLVMENLSDNDFVTTCEAEGIAGPRYCPSLESKLVRFPDRLHQVWLEPEGFHSNVVYPNGMSMTMPVDVQEKIVRTCRGLEQARFTRPGYGVQYEFVDPQQLYPTLETKLIGGLFLAGQINGTTGYEEAAAQGVIAGMNAACSVQGKQQFSPSRTNSYIGVMIDDLTTRGATEPYRMLTSRSEYRCHLRPDNADLRLTQAGRDVGAVSDERYRRHQLTKHGIDDAFGVLNDFRMSRGQWSKHLKQSVQGEPTSEPGDIVTATDVLCSNKIAVTDILGICPALKTLQSRIGEFESLFDRIKIEAQYRPVVARQQQEAELLQRESAVLIPHDFDYEVTPLSTELKNKLSAIRPPNISALSRTEGMTPVAVLQIHQCLLLQRGTNQNDTAQCQSQMQVNS